MDQQGTIDGFNRNDKHAICHHLSLWVQSDRSCLTRMSLMSLRRDNYSHYVCNPSIVALDSRRQRANDCAATFLLDPLATSQA
jgi:hypothetical protein